MANRPGAPVTLQSSRHSKGNVWSLIPIRLRDRLAVGAEVNQPEIIIAKNGYKCNTYFIALCFVSHIKRSEGARC